ncbi:MAG: T9SS type A sorting domain-containing protein [candidate division WOR-3 bacterium]
MKRFLSLFIAFAGFLSADPKENRLLIATSPDGLVWTRQNQVFYDSADVPDAVVGPGGRVYLYFQNFHEPDMNKIYVGFSNDGLTGWIFGSIVISGTEYWPGTPCDPDIIIRGDTFRLYFTGDPYGDGNPETYSATSFDGMNFIIDSGVRFQISGAPVLDPSLLWTVDTCRYFAGGIPGINYRAHSTDGINFIRDPDFHADSFMMANGIAVPGGYRFYCFKEDRGIKSLFSTNGVSWSFDAGYRLQLDTMTGLEHKFVKDPTVVKTGSGYIMYYVTKIPPSDIAESRSEDFSFNVCPNPTRNLIKLTVNLPEGVRYSLRLYDAGGSMVKDISQPRETTPTSFVWAPEVPPGVYFLRLTAGNVSVIRRITILR